ncbi:MAG: ABC transporter substrate-binding protein [Pusillimonas sp.]
MKKTAMGSLLAGTVLVLASAVTSAEVKIGFIGPFSGPTALLGQEQYDGLMLAIEMAGGKLGGQSVTVIREDDQIKPELGAQATRKLIELDKVDTIVGLSATNVLMASLPRIVESGKVALASNAGPAVLAGAQCKPNVFVTAWQSDGPSEAMGKYVQEKGFKNVFLMAPNYQAGKDMLGGFKRYYKGEIVDEIYTQVGQTDYSAEITQIQMARPEAVFVFYPGGMGINFTKQMAQAGLLPNLPVFSVFVVDPTTLPAIGNAAEGITASVIWDAEIDNPQNKAFVEAFRKKHNRTPSYYAAAGFDSGNLLGAAIDRLNGDLTDNAKFAAAVKQAGSEFKSVRGQFSFNTNNMPLQNYYIFQYQKAGDTVKPKLMGAPLEGHADVYVANCPMK